MGVMGASKGIPVNSKLRLVDKLTIDTTKCVHASVLYSVVRVTDSLFGLLGRLTVLGPGA